MARLHEYQGKAILKNHGIAVPRGGPASSADEARRIAHDLGGRVVVKIQAWTTNRKALGGVVFAATPDEAAAHAQRMLAMKIGNFPVTHVLVEEMLPIKDELFVSLFIDDRERGPAMLLSLVGGSGIEERAKQAGSIGGVQRLACDPANGPDESAARALLEGSQIARELHAPILAAVKSVFAAARASEARSLEINPLVTTTDGRVVAADCRMTIDDYAAFRHPDLGIEIAREFDHPPTPLERIAYAVEQDDHRGTFYFAQLNTADTAQESGAANGAAKSKGLIGFHGAGGGGSMMSMDAITAEGFTIANFCDTSGNPSSAKVYRAARIILSQPGLIGYFGSGSGVANQEQFWSAYGLAKAFWEMSLPIPAVIRLGGNTEDRAVEILQDACKGLAGKVEGYKKDDPPRKIAQRFADLVAQAQGQAQGSVDRASRPEVRWPLKRRVPAFVGAASSASFAIKGGRVWIDGAAWKTHAAAIISRSTGLLRDEAGASAGSGGGRPALAVKPEEFLAKDSEMIACEVECRRDGIGTSEGAVFVELDIPGL